jgi:Protein of unknown function (DUF3866)
LLKLRRGTVAATDPLEVEVGGERRRAWADAGMVGECRAGDEVIVNTAAIDLRLGSGGFDVVHVNLTRGLEGGETPEGVHVMKLNYSSLQHAVDPVEEPVESDPYPARPIPVAVLPLHGHLAPLAWGARTSGRRIGFVQAGGGGLPGTLSRDVAELLERELLAGHVTVAPSYGGEREAISLTGALHAAAGELGWDAAIVGPGPGILGSETRYGHGGMAALDGAHAALSLQLQAILSPRMSAGDPRPRHRGLSHHTRAVLELLLAGVYVPVPANIAELPQGSEAATALREACDPRHPVVEAEADLEGYVDSGLPTRTMGRKLEEDRLFFAAPLAAGRALTDA